MLSRPENIREFWNRIAPVLFLVVIALIVWKLTVGSTPAGADSPPRPGHASIQFSTAQNETQPVTVDLGHGRYVLCLVIVTWDSNYAPAMSCDWAHS